MSRIGKKPVQVPAGVTATVSGQTVTMKGPKGELKYVVNDEVLVKLEENTVAVTPANDSKDARAKWGMSRTMIENLVKGVKDGYEKKLEIQGVGYLAAIQGKTLQLRVGFANEVHKTIPAGLTVTCPDQTHIVIQGADKQMVGQFAAEVRSIRRPEPYKGKGIRYDGEVVRRKAGKATIK